MISFQEAIEMTNALLFAFFFCCYCTSQSSMTLLDVLILTSLIVSPTLSFTWSAPTRRPRRPTSARSSIFLVGTLILPPSSDYVELTEYAIEI